MVAGVHAREKMSIDTGTLFGPQGGVGDLVDTIPAEYAADGQSYVIMEYEQLPDTEYHSFRHQTTITVHRPDGTIRRKTFVRDGDYVSPSGRPIHAGTAATYWLRRMGFPEVLAVV